MGEKPIYIGFGSMVIEKDVSARLANIIKVDEMRDNPLCFACMYML